jgi:hypothetical protein
MMFWGMMFAGVVRVFEKPLHQDVRIGIVHSNI